MSPIIQTVSGPFADEDQPEPWPDAVRKRIDISLEHDVICITTCREPSGRALVREAREVFASVHDLSAMGGVTQPSRAALAQVWAAATARRMPPRIVYVALAHVVASDDDGDGCQAFLELAKRAKADAITGRLEPEDLEMSLLERLYLQAGCDGTSATALELADALRVIGHQAIERALEETRPSRRAEFEVFSGLLIDGADGVGHVWLAP